ncbi:MAG: glycosyltransferase [Phenylobacterium sp.]|uniref:glycosyltransferase family 4 protein n=1 Tax=Phenylobacterium sp. TaxID=1871053 RepID=UPI0025FABE4C|nr:glycosyltransferase family 4 protein [Phenylobacterium sp.]MBI1198460.1 glycosyltransferase [Phenylobacterium sp.]
MKTIVHVTADFPDPMAGAKTRSVLNLIDNTGEYRHVVYSLNRANWKTSLVALPFAPDRTALAYGAPPKGFLHATRLKGVADWILSDLAAKGIVPDLIHAHKFSVEGLVALDIGRELGRPFVCDIWGDTDLRITEVRRDLAPKWREILREARAIFACAPWATDKFEARLGLDRAKTTVLPPIVQDDSFTPSAAIGQPRLMTLFNLNVHKRKNFGGLARAIMTAAKTVPDISLDVWGVGTAEAFCEVTEIIHGVRGDDRIRLKGRLPEGEFTKTLGGYAAFVMPTLRETFGMVFVEALFSGLPILYTKGWSVDGLFDPSEVGYACNSSDDEDIRRGLLRLVSDEAELKASIAELAARGGLAPYTRAGVVATYRQVIEAAL